jgi:tetratricopeptide (TPR) repeat protein
MILALLAAAAAAQSPEEARFADCVALTETSPAKALEAAGAWQVSGGGVLARQCAGLAYAAQKRWLPAAAIFEQAARDAEKQRDGRASLLWVQAGNAALAGGNPAKARDLLDAGLAGGALSGADAGEAHLDRARASFALKNNKAARADLDAATKLVPDDPLGWLLSATLARIEGDLARAQADIGEAAKRSPDDASVALEAGNIAILSGSENAARTAWEAAVKTSPDGPAGKAAAQSLSQLAKPAPSTDY